jgi:hypothetical protein
VAREDLNAAHSVRKPIRYRTQSAATRVIAAAFSVSPEFRALQGGRWCAAADPRTFAKECSGDWWQGARDPRRSFSVLTLSIARPLLASNVVRW